MFKLELSSYYLEIPNDDFNYATQFKSDWLFITQPGVLQDDNWSIMRRQLNTLTCLVNRCSTTCTLNYYHACAVTISKVSRNCIKYNFSTKI